jgi:periplasmic protein TonB
MKLSSKTAGTFPAPSLPGTNRSQTALVTLAVLLAHAGLLGWLLTSSGQVQPPELAVVTMELLASHPAPVQASQPAPKPAPSQTAKPTPTPTPTPKAIPQPEPKPAPAAVAQAEPSPLPATAPSAAPAASTISRTAAAPAAAAMASASPAPAPAPARVELPSASADYLNNPKPAYPPLSRRLREEGKVVLRVLIETDGTASRAEIRSSSGYERLDQAARQAVLKWRYVPARRNGVPEAMWFDIPVNFVLE